MAALSDKTVRADGSVSRFGRARSFTSKTHGCARAPSGLALPSTPAPASGRERPAALARAGLQVGTSAKTAPWCGRSCPHGSSGLMMCPTRRYRNLTHGPRYCIASLSTKGM